MIEILLDKINIKKLVIFRKKFLIFFYLKTTNNISLLSRLFYYISYMRRVKSCPAELSLMKNRKKKNIETKSSIVSPNIFLISKCKNQENNDNKSKFNSFFDYIYQLDLYKNDIFTFKKNKKNSKFQENKSEKEEFMIDASKSSLFEILSDPNILSQDESALVVLILSYFFENINNKLNIEKISVIILQYFFRYVLIYMIHHHVFIEENINKLLTLK